MKRYSKYNIPTSVKILALLGMAQIKQDKPGLPTQTQQRPTHGGTLPKDYTPPTVNRGTLPKGFGDSGKIGIDSDQLMEVHFQRGLNIIHHLQSSSKSGPPVNRGTLPKGFGDSGKIGIDEFNGNRKGKSTIKIPIKLTIAVGLMIVFAVVLALPNSPVDLQSTTSTPTPKSDVNRSMQIKTIFSDEEVAKINNLRGDDRREYIDARFVQEKQRMSGIGNAELMIEVREWANPSDYPFTCDGCKDNKEVFDQMQCPDLIANFKENVGWAARQYIAHRILESNCG